MKKGILYGVGVGPGDPELMTLLAVKTIKNCSVTAVPISAAAEKFSSNQSDKMIALPDK